MIASRWWRPAELVASLLAILVLYFTWGAMLGLLQELLNAGPMWVFAPLGALQLLPALIEAKPLIDRAGPRGATVLAAVVVLLGWGAAAAAPAYSADRQQRFVIQHITDAGAKKASWSILNDGAPLPPAFGSGWRRGKLPLSEVMRWIEPAPPEPQSKPPSIQLLSEVRDGNERTLTLRIASNGNDQVELIAPEEARIRSAGVPGFIRPIDQQADGKYRIACSGRTCDGATLQLTTDQPNPIHVLVVGSRNTLPASAAPLLDARPRFSRPQYSPDASIAFTSMNL